MAYLPGHRILCPLLRSRPKDPQGGARGLLERASILFWLARLARVECHEGGRDGRRDSFLTVFTRISLGPLLHRYTFSSCMCCMMLIDDFELVRGGMLVLEIRARRTEKDASKVNGYRCR